MMKVLHPHQIYHKISKKTANSKCPQLYSCSLDRRLPFNQLQLNDLIRDQYLPKQSAELLASRLQEKNLLYLGISVTFYWKKEEFLKYFTFEDGLVFCIDIHHLLLNVGLRECKPKKWRLFIDSSKRSLKRVLLHNGNKFGSIPIGHSITLKTKYENTKLVLDKLKYYEHRWLICMDFKNGEVSVRTAGIDVQSIHVFCAIGIPELNLSTGSKMCDLQVIA